MTDETSNLIELTAEIVAAHVSHNNTATSDIPGLIRNVFAALSNAQTPAVPDAAPLEPAVPIRSSVRQDYIVCLEDGARLKMLRRYLRTRYEMTPEEYRAKWNLPRDYPMVAPAYAEQRRGLAQKIGLGRKKAPAIAEVVEVASKSDKVVAPPSGADAAAHKKRGRPPKVVTVEAAAARSEVVEG